MIEHVTKNPYSFRVIEQIATHEDVLTYGYDNLYPQRMEMLHNISPITKASVNLMANFYRGDGFENGDLEVNAKGETANDVLFSISQDLALFQGFAILVNGNGLGSAISIEHIPFDYVRLGIPNQSGRISYCRVSNNWEGINEMKLPQDLRTSKRYRLYNPQTMAQDAISGRGQVFYYSPKKNSYPLSSIDPIIETAQSDAELQYYELANIVNGFIGLSIFKYPGTGDLTDEEENIKQKLQQFQGSRNANSILVAGIDEDFTGDLIEQIPANNNDTLFINTTLNVKNRILQNFALPAGLMGMLPEGAVFTATQLADDYTYMNLRTKDQRNVIARQMQKLGFSFGQIVPNQFESSQMLNNENGQTTNISQPG